MALYLGNNKVTIKGGIFNSGGTAINNQNKTVTPTTSTQTITADSGYTGLGTVTVNRIPTNYLIPSGNKSITANGTNIDVAQYATVSVNVSGGGSTPDPMTLPTSTSSSATSGYTNKATISRSTSNQYLNIPPGYLESGAYYTINATPNGSVTAPASISGSAASVSTGTNTLTLTKTVSVTPNVTAVGYISAGTAGNSSVSLTANVTTKSAATYTPGTTNQTIASGTYLTGTQTISGDSNLVAGNIKKGISIFGVTGSYEGSGGSSSLNVQGYHGMDYVTATSYTATDVSLTVAVTGTYKISWMGFRNTTSGTSGSQLYINNSAYGSATTTFTSSYGQEVILSGVSLTAGQVVTVRARARSTSYRMYVGNLIIEQTA